MSRASINTYLNVWPVACHGRDAIKDFITSCMPQGKPGCLQLGSIRYATSPRPLRPIRRYVHASSGATRTPEGDSPTTGAHRSVHPCWCWLSLRTRHEMCPAHASRIVGRPEAVKAQRRARVSSSGRSGSRKLSLGGLDAAICSTWREGDRATGREGESELCQS